MSHADAFRLGPRHLAVRRRAFANLVLGMIGQAERTAGRLAVEPISDDCVALRFRDVRTLVRESGRLGFAHRDVVVLLLAPPEWPFLREAALLSVVRTPGDWAHANSDGHAICIDLAGIVPERAAQVVYDVLRLARRRLDHAVDAEAAAFMRGHLHDLPSDPRPLVPADAPGAAAEATAPPAECAGTHDAVLASLAGDLAVAAPVRDLSVGVLAVATPALATTTFLRLAPAAGPPVDGARAAFVAAARPLLRASRPGWSGGPGVVVDPNGPERGRLAAELAQLARGLDVLADPAIARSYLETRPKREGGDPR